MMPELSSAACVELRDEPLGRDHPMGVGDDLGDLIPIDVHVEIDATKLIRPARSGNSASVEPERGIEPRTYALRVRRSAN